MQMGLISERLNHQLTGVGNYTYNLFNEIDKLKKNNIYLINYAKNNSFQTLIEIILDYPLPIQSRSQIWYLSLPFRINNQYRNLDLIHNPFQIPTFFKFKKAKYIITVHDLTSFLFPDYVPYAVYLAQRCLLPKTLKDANQIITDSNYTKNDIINHFDIPEDRISVIYIGVDTMFQPLNDQIIEKFRREKNLGCKYILYVGTLAPHKNIPLLIKAFYQVKSRGINYKLVISGKSGHACKEIHKLVNQLNLQDDVLFVGYIPKEDLPSLYNAADVFVFPSLYEGFGLPPLEAMACGCPVITSNTSSLPEVVGNAGIMVDPYDVNGLANAIYDVLTDPDLKEYMIKEGLKQAKLFSWERCAKETLDVYYNVMDV